MFVKMAWIAAIILPAPMASATLTLERGSYNNRTFIDTAKKAANLVFTYEGCDPNPSPENIRLETDGVCKNPKDLKLSSLNGKTVKKGLVGKISVSYDDAGKSCFTPTKHTIQTYVSLKKFYDKFGKNGCFPTIIALEDSQKKIKGRFNQDKSLCPLPETLIKKNNFPTSKFEQFALRANDKGFRFGNDTKIRYDHDNKNWCITFGTDAEKCRAWATPLPLAYTDDNTKQVHVEGAVILNPNGTASIRAIDSKRYNTTRSMWEAVTKGALLDTNISKGRIDYKTWKDELGRTRSLATVYERDGPIPRYQRSINFYARNVFGSEVTHNWCPKEHCFVSVTDEKLLDSKCNLKPEFDGSLGGSGNSCASCVGVTPGICAVRPQELKYMKGRIDTGKKFEIAEDGEYLHSKDIGDLIAKSFSVMVDKPQIKGCRPGYAGPYFGAFGGSFEEESDVSRATNSVKKSKKKRKPGRD